MTLLKHPSAGSFNNWLATLPTTAFVILVGALLAIATVVVVLVCFILQRAIGVDVLIALFAFDAAMLHVGYQSYKTKRMTFIPNLVPTPGQGGGNSSSDETMGANAPGGVDLAQSQGGTMYHVMPADQLPDYLRALPEAGRRASPPPAAPAGSVDGGGEAAPPADRPNLPFLTSKNGG